LAKQKQNSISLIVFEGTSKTPSINKLLTKQIQNTEQEILSISNYSSMAERRYCNFQVQYAS
jgi:hypothetical protein